MSALVVGPGVGTRVRGTTGRATLPEPGDVAVLIQTAQARPLGCGCGSARGGPAGLSLSRVEDGSCPVNGVVSATSATSNRCSWYRSATVAED